MHFCVLLDNTFSVLQNCAELSARGYSYMESPDTAEDLSAAVETTGFKPSRRSGGGKLSRSETVTVRLDPKLNYLCELAARAQRRTKSSFIEWAIGEALKDVGIPGEKLNANGDLWTIDQRNSDLWDVDEPDRLVALAAFAPSLMTHEEQVLWKLITTSGYLWRGSWGEDGNGEEVWQWDPSNPYKITLERLRHNWDIIRAVAEGKDVRGDHYELKTQLIRNQTLGAARPPGSFDEDLDSDVPF